MIFLVEDKETHNIIGGRIMEDDDFSQRLVNIFFPKLHVFSGPIEKLSGESELSQHGVSIFRSFTLNNALVVYNFGDQMELKNNDYVNAVCIKDWFSEKLNVVALHNASTNACYYKSTFMLSTLILLCLPFFFIFGALFLLSPFTAPITLLFWGAIPVGMWGWLNAFNAKKIVQEFQRKQNAPLDEIR